METSGSTGAARPGRVPPGPPFGACGTVGTHPAPRNPERSERLIDTDDAAERRLLFVYQLAVRHPAMTRAQLVSEGHPPASVDQDLDELAARGLLKPGKTPNTWDAVPPDVALTAAAGRLERRAADTRELAYELSRIYQQVRATYASDRHGIRSLGSLQELDNAINDVVTRAERDIRLLRNPSPHTSLAFRAEQPSDRRRLVSAQGHPLRCRCVYDARTLELPGGGAVVLARVEAGEEARFLTPLPISVTIADEEIAVLDLTSYDSSAVGSMVITERRLVAALNAIVDTFWQLAVPMSGPAISELDERGHRVLRLLAAGATDAAIAEQVGISQRTVERRVRALMEQLGVTTRFQAGVQAARRGWL